MVVLILLTLYEYINLIREQIVVILGCLTMATEEEGTAGVIALAILGTQVIDAMVDALTDGVITNGLR